MIIDDKDFRNEIETVYDTVSGNNLQIRISEDMKVYDAVFYVHSLHRDTIGIITSCQFFTCVDTHRNDTDLVIRFRYSF